MIALNDENFAAEVATGITVVKFWAEWCGPCKSLAPVVDELANEYADKAKFASVDIDSTTLAKNFSIRGVPTILFFKDGQVVNTIVGAQSKGRLQLALDTVLA